MQLIQQRLELVVGNLVATRCCYLVCWRRGAWSIGRLQQLLELVIADYFCNVFERNLSRLDSGSLAHFLITAGLRQA